MYCHCIVFINSFVALNRKEAYFPYLNLLIRSEKLLMQKRYYCFVFSFMLIFSNRMQRSCCCCCCCNCIPHNGCNNQRQNQIVQVLLLHTET